MLPDGVFGFMLPRAEGRLYCECALQRSLSLNKNRKSTMTESQIVYDPTNPAMPGLVKIGKTVQLEVEERMKRSCFTAQVYLCHSTVSLLAMLKMHRRSSVPLISRLGTR